MDALERVDPETGEVTAVAGSMPPAVAAAIVAVKKQIKQLGSDEDNKHAGYKYVSVDKFYERVGPLMAEAGLALMIDETESRLQEGKSGNPWLFVRFSLSFVHESGAMSFPVRRSCALPISGPQAFGAAQSYIEKQFLRQVFKVPTGDKDADETAPKEGDAPSRAAPVQQGSRRPPPSPAAEPNAARDEAKKRYGEIRREIDNATSADGIDELVTSLAWQSMEKHVMTADPGEVGANIIRKLVGIAEARKASLGGGAGDGYGEP